MYFYRASTKRKNVKFFWGLASQAPNLPRSFQHGLKKNPVPCRRVIDQDVGHGADELAILQDRAAGHALDDAAGGGQEGRVGHPEQEVAAVLRAVGIDF